MATALIAMFVAASSASAATFGGGSIKLDFKSLKTKVATKGHSAKTSTGGTFPFSENAGTMDLTKVPSGSLNIGAKSTSITLTHANKKKIVLQSFVEKMTSGKGQLTAKIGGKGKAIAFFDQASTNRVNPSATFTTLAMSTSSMTLTKAGAAALNKAFGLKKPARGKDPRYKAKGKVGSASFTANRSLTVTGGQSQTVYDKPFVDELRKCNIELSAVGPATAIPKDPGSAPEGGVILPINSAGGGTLTASTLIGQVNHIGGTRLDRPAPGQPGNTTGKAEYHSPLTDFKFGLQGGALHTLTATIVNANNLSTNIGDVTGTPTATLTDTAGTVTLSGDLVLSTAASGTLSQAAPPLGADCPIPAGSKIGAVTMTADVS